MEGKKFFLNKSEMKIKMQLIPNMISKSSISKNPAF